MRALAVVVVFGLACFAATAQQQEKKAEEKPAASRSLKVNLNYGGSGTVDAKHKITVFLFDSPDFIKGDGGVLPFAVMSAETKNGIVAFEKLDLSPVYVVAIYDPTGEYDAQSPPPSGSSIGLYSKEPGIPEPVKMDPGASAAIDLPFDDTVKMP